MIRKKEQNRDIVIDIDGPDGNAYFLIAAATKLARQCGMDEDGIVREMKSGDYYELLRKFNKYFPFVSLETNNFEIINELEK